MSQTGAIWLVILAALVAANLPFLNHRVALVGPVASPRKGLLIRLVELVVLYFLVGGFAMLLERRAGRVCSGYVADRCVLLPARREGDVF